MSIKKKLAMGIATGALAVSMIGGGTYAYFSDTETSTNTFKAGTLDLVLNPTEIINVDNIKPGDTIKKKFKLKNEGTLDIAKVLLKTNYVVTDVKGDNVEDLGEHILVEFMHNNHKGEQVISKTTLAALKNMEPDAVANKHLSWFEEKGGLVKGDTDDLEVKFEFVDTKEDDQNQFQGDSLQLTWEFKAIQGKGVEIKK